MSDGPPNSYDAPKADEAIPADPKPLPPPVTRRRLVLGMLFYTVGILALWAHTRGVVMVYLVGMAAMIADARLDDPMAYKKPLNPRDLLAVLIGLGVLGGIYFVIRVTSIGPWLTALMKRPEVYVTLWVFCCGRLVARWWRRRNNPPLAS